MSTSPSLRERLAGSAARGQRGAFLLSLPRRCLPQAQYDWPFWARPDQLRTARAPGARGSCAPAAAPARRAPGRSGCAPRPRAASTAPAPGRAHRGRRARHHGRGSLGPAHHQSPDLRPRYRPRLRRLEWPNGAVALLYSAEEPDRLRGPQCEAAWFDELASWSYPEAYHNLMFGLRLGVDPRCVVTSTPRPTKLIRELIARQRRCRRSPRPTPTATTWRRPFLEQILYHLRGHAPGTSGDLRRDPRRRARGPLDDTRASTSCASSRRPSWQRLVVAVDPAVTSGEEADETGIIVVGLQRG